MSTNGSERCGCLNRVDLSSGILRRITTCPYHQEHRRDPKTLDGSYYRELGMLDEHDEPLPTRHLDEIREALGPWPIPPRGRTGRVLEIGCGVSPYARSLEDAGWLYSGVDISAWAARWMRAHGFTHVIAMDWIWSGRMLWDFILACHSLEHMIDAPGALAKMAEHLRPQGRLWILVPDDSDPVNPDHNWFFTAETLRAAIEKKGLIVEALEIRQIVDREKYLYVRARKPGSP